MIVDRRYLELQAEQIEQILRDNGLAAWVDGGEAGARLVTYRVTAAGNQANLLASLKKLDEILALRLNVPGEVQIRRVGGQIQVTLPHGRFRPVSLQWLQQQAAPPQTMILGLDTDNHPVVLRPSHPGVAHVLVAGTTGSGKTVLLRTMIVSLAANTGPGQAEVLIVDPKGYKFRDLAGLPHLAELVSGIENNAALALAVLARLLAEMEQRDRAAVNEPRLYLFIDELADLMLVGGKPFETALTRLTQRGREAGIHVIAGTQKPTAAVIGSLAKANFPTRIVGAVASPEDAKVASGMAQSGAEKLAGQGDFLLISKVKPPIRFQAAYAGPKFIGQVRSREAVSQPARLAGRPPAAGEAPAAGWATTLRKLIPFPGRGGHNRREFPAEQIADARRGLSPWQLRQKYPELSGSRAERLVKEYGKVRSA